MAAAFRKLLTISISARVVRSSCIPETALSSRNLMNAANSSPSSSPPPSLSADLKAFAISLSLIASSVTPFDLRPAKNSEPSRVPSPSSSSSLKSAFQPCWAMAASDLSCMAFLHVSNHLLM